MSQKTKSVIKFLIPSLLGVLLFLVPINNGGKSEIVVGIIGSWLKTALGDTFVPVLALIVVLSAVLSFWHRVRPIEYISKNSTLNGFFTANTFWLAVRVIGAVITILTYFKIGPEQVWSIDTGGNMLFSILPTCAIWYIVGGMLLPLLTDYGLLDLFSSLFQRISRPLFRVPGRAMIDCITSWMGSSVCGTYLTISQYETGFYNAREAAIIISNFSLLSISFCSLIASMLGLADMFGKFYLTIIISGVVCAIVIPRLWPLNRFPETYDSISGNRATAELSHKGSDLKIGYNQAIKRAENAPNFIQFLKKGLTNTTDLMFNTLPVIMSFGTVALMLATYTPVFDYLGIPLGAFLKLFHVPDSMKAGSAILMGFADQFIPVIIGSALPSMYTRFMIGCICILQILYISDIGALILSSRMPFKLWHMFVIYLERVIISIPIVALFAKLYGIV